MQNTLLYLILFSLANLCFAQNTPLPPIQIHDNWEFKQANKSTWKKASVPGVVHTDLLANGDIPDPFYRNNEEKVQWIEQEDWEYQTTFDVPAEYFEKEHIELTFKGLDTYADVYLNKQKILSADNMFCSWEVDVKEYLKSQKNKLEIYFHSPIKKALPQYKALPYELPAGNDAADEKVSVFTRKAPYHYGWDWSPRLVTSGIWRPIELNAWNEIKLTDFYIEQQELTKEKATLKAFFTIEADGAQTVFLKIQRGNHGRVYPWTRIDTVNQEINLKKGIQTYQLDFEINKPQLWWTNGLGRANLYEIQGQILDKKQENILAEQSNKIGLRTIELVQEKDSIGTSYYFKLNGMPVFMKGANYVPASNFLPSVTYERYYEIIRSAVDANMNMLRVWGGGIYENDEFYDLCDKHGILVWQDFMFACSMYPGDEAFFKNVEKEVEQNVQRLRQHPSIALWCGNNEMEVAWHNWGWQKQFGYSPEDSTEIRQNYLHLFEKLIPETLAKYDSIRPYVPTSPLSNWGTAENFNHSSMHYWGVWHGEEPFSEFKNNVGRFNSEYGFQSFPDLKNIESFTLPKDRKLSSEVLQKRQKSYKGNRLLFDYIERLYNPPKDFEDFLYLNQLTQAEGIKYAIEQHRKKRPHCMGSLYWQLNDCWPAISWSSTDYYGNWKALHYFVKEAYQDVIVVSEIEDSVVTVSVVIDGTSYTHGHMTMYYPRLSIKLINFEGKGLSSKSSYPTIKFNESQKCFEMPLAEILPDSLDIHSKDFFKDKYFLIELRYQGERRYLSDTRFGRLWGVPPTQLRQNILYFYPPKDLALKKPNIQTEIISNGKNYRIKLSTDYLAKNVYLDIDTKGRFTKNFFDLLPNSPVYVEFKTQEDIPNFKERLKIKTLVNDSD